jgi:MFS family permease
MKRLLPRFIAARFLGMVGISAGILASYFFLCWWFPRRHGVLFGVITEGILGLCALVGVAVVVVLGCYSSRAAIRWFQWPTLYVLVFVPALIVGFWIFLSIACSLPYGCL